MATRLKLYLFDIDGTLLIAQGAGREAKARAMIELFGTDGGVKTFPFGGKTDWQILTETLAPHGFSHDQIGSLMPEYERRFADHMQAIIADFPVNPLAGAFDVLRQLQTDASVVLGIVTGNTSLTAPIKLRAAGFDPSIFVVGAYGNESANRNDLPGFALQRAIKHTGQAIQPEDVLIIGDTVADVDAARAIGGKVAIVFTGFEEREHLIAAKPDYLLDDLTHFFKHVVL